MRHNKRDRQAHLATVKAAKKARSDAASKGIATRAKAMKQVAGSSDESDLKLLSKHPNKHVQKAASYKLARIGVK
jgi:hypothetical protein